MPPQGKVLLRTPPSARTVPAPVSSKPVVQCSEPDDRSGSHGDRRPRDLCSGIDTHPVLCGRGNGFDQCR